MVMMVLSKLRTLTVVSVISSTVPLMPAFSTVIQSPLWSISLLVRRIPATSPEMVSLNTSMRMAEVAPSPARRVNGLRLTIMATITITDRNHTTIFSTPQKVWRY